MFNVLCLIILKINHLSTNRINVYSQITFTIYLPNYKSLKFSKSIKKMLAY